MGAVHLLPLRGILLILLVVLTQSSCDHTTSSQDDYVLQTVEGYVRDGLAIDDILGPADSTIMVSGDFFSFPSGAVEEVSDEIRKKLAEGGDSTVFRRSLSPKEFLLEIVSIFTKDTPYSGKVRLNEPPDPNSLNIYFLSRDPERLVTHFKKNCAYIGWGNVIICDGNFVKDQLEALTNLDEFHNIAIIDFKEMRLVKPSELDSETKSVIDNSMRGGFLAWYLGHEIGHAVLHADYVRDSGRSVHFDDPDYDRRELEADLYVARALVEPSVLTTNFWVTIGEFIEHEYRKVYEELKPLGRTREVNPRSDFFPLRYEVTIEYSQYHMPLLLRASRIVDILTQQSPGLDSTGHYQKLRQNIKTKRSRTDVFVPIVVALAVLILAAGAVILLIVPRRRERQ